jgi:hypothetical protein
MSIRKLATLSAVAAQCLIVAFASLSTAEAAAANGGAVARENGMIHVGDLQSRENGMIHVGDLQSRENGMIHVGDLQSRENGMIHVGD